MCCSRGAGDIAIFIRIPSESLCGGESYYVSLFHFSDFSGVLWTANCGSCSCWGKIQETRIVFHFLGLSVLDTRYVFGFVSFHLGFVFVLVEFRIGKYSRFGFISLWFGLVSVSFCFGFILQSTVSQVQ